MISSFLQLNLQKNIDQATISINQLFFNYCLKAFQLKINLLYKLF